MIHTYIVPFVKEKLLSTYNWKYCVPFLIGETKAAKHVACWEDVISQSQSQL